MDVLTDVLSRTGARGTVFARTSMRAPWGIRFSPEPRLHFHAVLWGTCWLRGPAVGTPLKLSQGDLVLLNGPIAYELADGPEAPAEPFERLLERLRDAHDREDASDPEEGHEALLLCGAYDFADAPNPALAGLPEVLRVPASAGRRVPSMRSALAVLTDELDGEEPGGQVVVDRLVDVLLVCSLRVWLDGEGSGRAGWLRALRDPDVGRALEAMHREPQESWTVETLARAARLSRAAFARRFSEVVGRPPMAYLTGWRMTLAAELLRDTDRPLSAIARHVGYGNPYSFGAAFKRAFGEAPGRYRARRRQREDEATSEDSPA